MPDDRTRLTRKTSGSFRNTEQPLHASLRFEDYQDPDRDSTTNETCVCLSVPAVQFREAGNGMRMEGVLDMVVFGASF